MLAIRIYFSEIIKNYKKDSYFEVFVNDDDTEFKITKRRGMVVVPGGAYSFISYRESQPVAFLGCANEFNCFILNYTCNQPYPIPHIELCLMINYIKSHRDEFKLADDDLTFVGFSAGGHLLASYSYLYIDIAKQLGIKPENVKPNKIALAYPVISMKIPTKSFTAKRITNNFDEDLIDLLSVENHISCEYPKTYIFASKQDKLVGFKHSQKFVDELVKNNVEHKYVLYNTVDHGISIANKALCINNEKYLEAANWFTEMIDFLN